MLQAAGERRTGIAEHKIDEQRSEWFASTEPGDATTDSHCNHGVISVEMQFARCQHSLFYIQFPSIYEI